MKHRGTALQFAPHLFVSAMVVGCLGAPATTPAAAQGVTVACVEVGAPAPAGALVCGRAQTVECGTTTPGFYVVAPTAGLCASARWSATVPLWSLGDHVVVVRDLSVVPAREVCTSTVTVVDTRAPAVTGEVLELWPPNHRMETFRASDCVEVLDACDSSPRAVFTWVQVDEPDDATGDGSTSGDVQFTNCDVVALRSERRGNRNGRVYSLGVRVSDRSGNVADAVCHVIVAHDRSGRPAVVDVPARHLRAPTSCR